MASGPGMRGQHGTRTTPRSGADTVLGGPAGGLGVQRHRALDERREVDPRRQSPVLERAVGAEAALAVRVGHELRRVAYQLTRAQREREVLGEAPCLLF